MPSPVNPIRSAVPFKRRVTWTWLVGGAFCVGAGVWAAWSPAPPAQTGVMPAVQSTVSGKPSEQAPIEPAPSIDSKLLAIKLWNAPPPPPPAASEKDAVASAKPLRLQLIGIIDDEDGMRRAAIYDVDSDRLYIVAGGERLGDDMTGGSKGSGQTVIQIAAKEVTLSDGKTTRRLVLADGEPS